MARRQEKLTFVKLILLLGIAVWIPTLLKMLAGTDEPTPLADPTTTGPVQVIEAKPVSFEQTDAQRPVLPAPSELHLRSTHVSDGRKFAMINGQLLQEGETLKWNSGMYLVRGIQDGRVVLLSNDVLYELKLDSNDVWGRWTPFESDHE